MNKIIIIGNAGKVPEQKQDGHFTFTVAVTERGYTKQDGTQVLDHTDWFNVAVFGKLTKVCELIRKGTKVMVEGRMRCYTMVDQQTNQKRDIWGITADSIELLSPKQDDAQQPAQQVQQQPQQMQQYQQVPQNSYQQMPGNPPQPLEGLPF